MARMDKDKLLRLLDTVRRSVEIGDSFEGSLQYLIPPDGGDGFEVTASIRVGNLDGQGGIIFIEPSANETASEETTDR